MKTFGFCVFEIGVKCTKWAFSRFVLTNREKAHFVNYINTVFSENMQTMVLIKLHCSYRKVLIFDQVLAKSVLLVFQFRTFGLVMA